jgi:metallo-beta-lactamase class B
MGRIRERQTVKAFAPVVLAACLAPAIVAAQVPTRCTLSEVSPFLARGFAGAKDWLTTPKSQYIEPFKAFDNVWHVGGCWVSAWVIVTPDGAILIDTLYEPLVGMLVENLGKAGVKLDSIKYVLMTHGHWDHVGGAERLKPLLKNARFAMSERGWDEATHNSLARPDFPPWKMIARDMVVKDGDVIALGGTKVTVYETPGHSHGTISFGYDVADGDKTYHAFTIGGLATTTIRDSKQAEDYVASVKRFKRIAVDPVQPVSAYIPTHTYQAYDLTATSDLMRARKPGDTHPMVDQAAFLKELERLEKAGEAKVASEKAAGR